jgi:hypothetical protein
VKKKPKNLPQEAEDIAHQVMEIAFEIKMKQQGGHIICNNDDKGNIALERSGMQAVDKQRKVRNISNERMVKDVRNVSSLWRPVKVDDKMANGLQCEFKDSIRSHCLYCIAFLWDALKFI